jgi:hypothetical protein
MVGPYSRDKYEKGLFLRRLKQVFFLSPFATSGSRFAALIFRGCQVRCVAMATREQEPARAFYFVSNLSLT